MPEAELVLEAVNVIIVVVQLLKAKVAPPAIIGVGKLLKVIFSAALCKLIQPLAFVTITV